MDVVGTESDCAGTVEAHSAHSTAQSNDTRRVTHKRPLFAFMFEANGP
jgi:hypothetical protein